jgi:hypothetical protein
MQQPMSVELPPDLEISRASFFAAGVRLAGLSQVLWIRFKSGRSSVMFRVTSAIGKLSSHSRPRFRLGSYLHFGEPLSYLVNAWAITFSCIGHEWRFHLKLSHRS